MRTAVHRGGFDGTKLLAPVSYTVGIDIGGTFTDIIAISDRGGSIVHKTLSTPRDPSIGFINGLRETAALGGMSLQDFLRAIDTIVHGTTVATNALLTLRGARTGLLTTHGLRDALEMRRGIREERYDNHFRNVTPLVPRHLRLTVKERMDADGSVITPLDEEDVVRAARKLKGRRVQAVAVCFMHAYKNAAHERRAAELLRAELPGTFVVASSEVLPSIRFYERLSTTAVSAFVGPIVSRYIDKLTAKLKDVGYAGQLLIMQSNGGVVAPEQVKRNPAVTVLSGPAAAPTAGAWYGRMLGHANCITVDMGGTSFDAALVIDGQSTTGTEGGIGRYRIALPALDIVTIGAGGGSIGWINQGGMMQMGPQSAGALPGPACYDRGGTLPTCTDADLVLGLLNPAFFAGGSLRLDRGKAEAAIGAALATPLGLSVVEAAAGMFRIINSNMAQGVRQVSVERGFDPREFLFVVAGGAGSLHASEICRELEIPLFVVPNVSSIFCAAGMLLGDLKHDNVRSYYTPFGAIDRARFLELFEQMKAAGIAALRSGDQAADGDLSFHPTLDMRYVGQYHEVRLDVPWSAVQRFDLDAILAAFHAEHDRQFGYALENEGTPTELINLRLRVVGRNERPRSQVAASAAVGLERALKEHRPVFIPEENRMREVPVYDGDAPIHGARITGPCVIEKVTTSILVGATHDVLVDALGSFIVYDRSAFPGGYSIGRAEPATEAIR